MTHQTWEYCYLTDHDLCFPSPDKIQRTPITVDKSKGDRNIDDAACRVIAKIGLEGWELVGNTSGNVTWFKRPAAGE